METHCVRNRLYTQTVRGKLFLELSLMGSYLQFQHYNELASSEENKGEIWCLGVRVHERLLLFKHQDHLVHSEIRMQEILGKQPREKDSSILCEAYSRYYLSRHFDLFIKMMSESLDC